jgi:hypothetical protein
VAEPLDPRAFLPFGWVMGGPRPTDQAYEKGHAHSSESLDIWPAHCFDPGHGGQTNVCSELL